jgi:ArsR family transcriptional regulator, lead/cadmium/zinc/bismuth-responsive transcriptional repressor
MPAKLKAQPVKADDAPNCDIYLVHLDSVRQGKQQVLPMAKAQQMADFFGVLADPNRLRLLSILVDAEMCVCDLAAVLEMTESAVSHQLRTLRSMNLVKYRRDGRNIYYSLADNHVVNLYHEVTEHLGETES